MVKRLIAWGSVLLTVSWMLPAGSVQAEPDLQGDLQASVDSIQSVEQVQQQIRESIQQMDQCAVGSCHNFNSTSICEAIGALDIRVDGKILNSGSGWSDHILPISDADLALMKLIFAQCKPSNYQYWNFGNMLHVLYSPTPEADATIRQQLGLPAAQRGQ